MQYQDHNNRPENSVIGGFVRNNCDGKNKGNPQVETPRADELSRINPEEAQERLQARIDGRKNNKGWPKGKPMYKKTKLAIMGIPKDALVSGDPAYARCVKLSKAYQKVRCREFAISHGFVSSGVNALLATAALALAASRYMYERATKADPDSIAQTLKAASQLASDARQNELAAWELCARESMAKRKAANAAQGLPWLVSTDEPEKAKRGRPKSAETKEQESLGLPPAGTGLEAWVAGVKLDVEVSDAGNGGLHQGSNSQVGPEEAERRELGNSPGPEDGADP